MLTNIIEMVGFHVECQIFEPLISLCHRSNFLRQRIRIHQSRRFKSSLPPIVVMNFDLRGNKRGKRHKQIVVTPLENQTLINSSFIPNSRGATHPNYCVSQKSTPLSEMLSNNLAGNFSPHVR
mmetsp:Transcript_26937/g.55006  ORF Transcript_26937/g.55006 Transcript_26937/m.55006 type:complete len:123 (-) Transcript_26937:860-1228(-)